MRHVARLSTTGRAGLALLLAAAVAGAQEAKPKGNAATEPVPREGAWMQLHEKFLERARQGKIDLLFLGDSITQGWGDNAVWKRYYGPRHAANFGIGGDRTQHVLWRLEHGEIEGVRPKAVVLMIGTNNIGSNTPEEIAEGVKAIVQKLKTAMPQTKILLLGIFPRGADRKPDQSAATVDPRTGQVNEIIKSLGDDKTVFYLDIGPKFLDADGKIPKDVMPDFLHLSVKGYRIWADAIEPTLWKLMEEP
jgi:lysophospholipase L1-like esterase